MEYEERLKQIIALIYKVEGLRLETYLDSAGIPTIGYGTTVYPNGVKVKLGDKCTKDQANEFLKSHLQKNVFPILEKYNIDNDFVYIALSSFVYNVGFISKNVEKSIKDKDWPRLAYIMKKYVYSKGRVVQGLINRREMEVDYFHIPY